MNFNVLVLNNITFKEVETRLQVSQETLHIEAESFVKVSQMGLLFHAQIILGVDHCILVVDERLFEDVQEVHEKKLHEDVLHESVLELIGDLDVSG